MGCGWGKLMWMGCGWEKIDENWLWTGKIDGVGWGLFYCASVFIAAVAGMRWGQKNVGEDGMGLKLPGCGKINGMGWGWGES